MNRILLASIAVVALAFGAVFLVTRQTARAASITVDSLADTVAEDDACTLREAIQNANDDTDGQPNADCDAGDPAGADSIVFDIEGGGTITLDATELPGPTQDLAIDGAGDIVLDAGDAVRFFVLPADVQFTLAGLSLANGLASNGGAIVVQDGTLTVDSCLFEGNLAEGGASQGGAIYVAEGDIEVSDSTFLENAAAGGGGAIYLAGGSALITGSTFEGNDTLEPGGAIAAFGSVVIETTDFVDNDSQTDGGALFAAGPLEITGGTFQDNLAFQQGGGVWATAFQITGTTFQGNTAEEGGGLYAGTDDDLEEEAEAALAAGPALLTDVTFVTNSADFGGGAFINNDATLDDVQVTANEGVGIVIDGESTVDISLSSFVLNTVGEDAAGGLRIEEGSIVSVTGSGFTDNSSPSRGGGISNAGNLTVAGSQFDGNNAEQGGGAIVNFGVLAVEASTFVNNSAGFGGGAINSETSSGDEPSVTVVDSSFAANTAVQGGALHNTDGWVKVQRSTFSNNSASEVGGALYVDDADDVLELVNSTLSGNTADDSGGGLFNSGIATILNSTILGNVAPGGGGIRLTVDSVLNVTNTVVAGSTDGDNCAFEGSADGVEASNISDDASCPEGLFVTVEDVEVGELADNGGPTETHLPADDSPLVEAGDDESCPDVDQRAEVRPAGEACDIGSVEVQEPALPTPTPIGDAFIPQVAKDVVHP